MGQVLQPRSTERAVEPPPRAAVALPIRMRSRALTALLILATLYTAYFAAAIIVPVTGAVLLFFLLSPVVRNLVRWHVPRPAAACLVIAVLVCAVSATLIGLSEPAAEWLREAPANISQLRERFREGPNPIADARQAADAVAEAVEEITGSEEGEEAQGTAVRVGDPALLDGVLTRLPVAMSGFVVTFVIALFLLMSGESLMRNVAAMGRTFAARRRTMRITRHLEHEIARYLGTVAIINTCLGVVVAGAMYLVGLPNPVLWGTLAGAMNFAPYLGAALTAFMIFVASAIAFDSVGAIVLPPIVFAAITVLEGQVITPLLVGRRLALSPVIVLLSVLLLGWLWGLAGAILAVPVMLAIRIVLVTTPRLRPIGTLLGK
jgi:predicted PurR-regulated permease PerM